MSTGLHSTLPPRDVTVQTLTEPGAMAVRLTVAAGGHGLDHNIIHPRIQKSGLSLVGHFQGLSPERVQILGETEMSFLGAMDREARQRSVDGFMARGICCAVVTAGQTIYAELLESADKHGCPVLVSEARSSVTINAIHALLDEKLAPRTRVHGVFIDVFGVGILLLGKSGIGKSECALELVQRGHRLVADDLVDCVLRPSDSVYGAAVDLLKNHLEVRGLGVLNIKDLFGVASVRDNKRIDLVVRLVASDDEEETWDRLGIDDEFYPLLGARIAMRRVPVRPGKNTSSTVEVAARNELLRQAGHHSAREFHARLAAAMGVHDPTALLRGKG